MIKTVYELNKPYEMNNCNGIKKGLTNFKIFQGTIPILFSACHAVSQTRETIVKPSDALTGGIVEYLCQNNGVYGICRTANLLDDPNYYHTGISLAYKEKIIDIITSERVKYFFDIHGSSDKYPSVVDIGTNNGLNTNHDKEGLDIIYRYLSHLGPVSIDNHFKASRDGNISLFVHQKTLIPCFQLEISRFVRFERLDILVDSLGNIIKDMNAKIKTKI